MKSPARTSAPFTVCEGSPELRAVAEKVEGGPVLESLLKWDALSELPYIAYYVYYSVYSRNLLKGPLIFRTPVRTMSKARTVFNEIFRGALRMAWKLAHTAHAWEPSGKRGRDRDTPLPRGCKGEKKRVFYPLRHLTRSKGRRICCHKSIIPRLSCFGALYVPVAVEGRRPGCFSGSSPDGQQLSPCHRRH